MNGTRSILIISRNKILQDLRTIILERAGFAVAAVHNDQDAIRIVESSAAFDVVLLCHTVPEASRLILVNRMKLVHPSMPILMLYNGFDPTEARVDGSLHSLESPEALVSLAKSLSTRM